MTTRKPEVIETYRATMIAMYKRTGGHFFDADTMKHFNSEVDTPVYQIGFNRLNREYVFVTSERDSFTVFDPERGDVVLDAKQPKYTVRHWNGRSVNVDTIGYRFESRVGAHQAAERYAHERAAALHSTT